jgi:hypothetical protein
MKSFAASPSKPDEFTSRKILGLLAVLQTIRAGRIRRDLTNWPRIKLWVKARKQRNYLVGLVLLPEPRGLCPGNFAVRGQTSQRDDLAEHA